MKNVSTALAIAAAFAAFTNLATAQTPATPAKPQPKPAPAAAQRAFAPAKIDASATFAQKATQGADGTWNEREILKLCPLEKPRTGKRGESIRFIAVAASKDCPSTE